MSNTPETVTKETPIPPTRAELIENSAEAHALLDTCRADLARLHADNAKCRAAVDEQTARLVSAREALNFYADETNWPFAAACDSFATNDRGERAREVLKG